MFERYNESARRTIVLSQEEARLLNHQDIGTEHLLLGLLLQEDTVVSQLLDQLGVSHEEVRAKVLELHGQGGEATRGHIPFTPVAKKALEMALREALQLGHNYIAPEHVLMGIVRHGRGNDACEASKILWELGHIPDEIRQELLDYMSRPARREASPPPFAIIVSDAVGVLVEVSGILTRQSSALLEGRALDELEILDAAASLQNLLVEAKRAERDRAS